MSAKESPGSFMYVETDIPPGMTIREWHAQRAAERPRRAERAARRRRVRIRLLLAITAHGVIRALPTGGPRRRPSAHRA